MKDFRLFFWAAQSCHRHFHITRIILLFLLFFLSIGVGVYTPVAAAAPFYPHACLEAHILPNSGHDINLHLNASQWFKMAKNWLTTFFGDDPAQPGQCN